jgi:hypothetical protein
MQLATRSSESLELSTQDLGKSLHRGPLVPYLQNLNLRLQVMVAIMLMEMGKMETGTKTSRYTICIVLIGTH